MGQVMFRARPEIKYRVFSSKGPRSRQKKGNWGIFFSCSAPRDGGGGAEIFFCSGEKKQCSLEFSMYATSFFFLGLILRSIFSYDFTFRSRKCSKIFLREIPVIPA